MTTPNQLRPTSAVCRFFVLLTLTLLLVNAPAVQGQGQENANTANSNASNTNSAGNSNVNTNGNTNSNDNQNRNANDNQNDNTNRSASQKSEDIRRDKLADKTWFYFVVTVMFAIVLIPFALTIVRAIRFSRATYGPLGLPEGSLRAMLAYTLVAFLGFYILASILSLSDFKPPEFLMGIVATVIGFYFGSRTGEAKGAGAAAKAGIIQGNVTNSAGTAVEKATVDLYQSGVKKDTEETDAKGNYKFDKVAAGDYEIQASADGSAPSDRLKVTVKAGSTQSVNLKLK